MVFHRSFPIFCRFTQHVPFIRKTGRNLFIFASWIPALIFFNDNVGEVTKITGQSMYPYLNTTYSESGSKDLCWVNKWGAQENLERGMLVSFWSPANPEVLAVKRIIALEGDKVFPRPPYPAPVAAIPAGHVWVEGDNRDGRKTLDSNYYGPISISLLQGKVTHVLWPWASAGAIRWREFRGRTNVIRGRKEDAPQWL
ncbi:peptidase S24/S26A/S26B/S26C [Amylocarpus encephaloides]|uniref:Mitochondrial inner membrane protease subunit 2 n=1 Tax=Amylocarpus encephaloides TaxID=45428 RepID=A0A9P7YH44_9HELO|nr:peptidase S24/S26A/S26B/S26C [Amylocarpus encephaloides]